jgi:hypothetical protein
MEKKCLLKMQSFERARRSSNSLDQGEFVWGQLPLFVAAESPKGKVKRGVYQGNARQKRQTWTMEKYNKV